MKNTKGTLSPHLEGKFELRGYTPGLMGLSTGSIVDWQTITLEEAEAIFEAGSHGGFLFRVEKTPKKKKEEDTETK